MKILVIASYYPHDKHPYSGIFNERCVVALKKACDYVEVLVPTPYVPPFLSLHRRWEKYSKIKSHEIRNGINVHRLKNFHFPKIGNAFWFDYGAYICCRRFARKLHKRVRFDVIVSFDLSGAGGLAWRVGRDIGVPSCGWAFGDDVRVSRSSSYGKAVIRSIKNLDLIFYQSYELLGYTTKLVNRTTEEMLSEMHVVLPHGIPIPVLSSGYEMRRSIRNRWRVADDEIVVLSLGRITKQKGIYELLDAMSFVSTSNKKIICLLVGSMPEYDETKIVTRMVEHNNILKNCVRMLPACNPNEVWEVLCGADIFAFTSYQEGMPNSLLEAMAVGLPAIAFAIPAVKELDSGTDSLIKIPQFNTRLFANAVLELSDSVKNRNIIGEKAKRHVAEHFQIDNNMARAVEKICKIIK